MKVLWFTGTPSLYKKQLNGYNGVGWIESLEKVISQRTGIELGLCFFHPDKTFKSKIGNTTYYPISLYNNRARKLKHYFRYRYSDAKEVEKFVEVIEDFKPDLIHVFGSEASFGLIAKHTSIPVIIHLQGLLNSCLNAFYPPGVNAKDVFLFLGLNPLKLITTFKRHKFFKHNTRREAVILSSCRFFMGRTEWDRSISSLYSPESEYFYCGEVLRDAFYEASPWVKANKNRIVIVSTISKTSYKGMDLILKTARLLKLYGNYDFEWIVLGVSEYKFWEWKLGFTCASVNVTLKGVVTADVLVEFLKASDMYIHPSYIDNSPNSICEAQLVGVPVISTNVGGVGSLINDGKTGMLVPANDPFVLAQNILELFSSPDKLTELGRNGRSIALKRHDRRSIISGLIDIYEQVVQQND
jgi:glycosyltransferase involved in cell wall biosynthesis